MKDYKEFKSRRDRLAFLLDDSVAIIVNSKESIRNKDCHYPFRSDSNFHYLSGFPEPDTIVMIFGGKNPKSIIFCQPKDEIKEIWNGYVYGPKQASKEFLFDEGYPLADAQKLIPKFIKSKKIFLLPSSMVGHIFSPKWFEINNKLREDLSEILDGMRVVKNDFEVNLMRKSADIAANAHIQAMKLAAPDKYEYEIEGEILNQFFRLGSRNPAYSSIVASGINGCTLHYIENDSQMKDGDLLLIDAGCEVGSYASDITRTFPVNGKFSSAQKEIYQLVLSAQKAAIEKVKVGLFFDDPHKEALKIIIDGLIDLGILIGSRDEVYEKELYKKFFMHRTSHWLGLDVHDVGKYLSKSKNSQAVKFTEGNVLTIEPGCYIRPSDHVSKEFWGIGVRIEDDVLVTSAGHDVLSKNAPKEIKELEEVIGTSNA
ncbi:aminopeptidase P N-terminal domain-containing protein [Methylophilaceae bacterium Uisw_099_01]